MIEFLQTYGLWIALAGVFIIMHRFGMGCCGGGHHHTSAPRDEAAPGVNVQGEKPSHPVSKSSGSCH
jgi:hypothetical protein